MTIPSWQQQELDQLSAEGLLSGVSPVYLSAIDQAESGGSGGGINSSGFGGFFGLGAGSTYPGGTPSSALLADPSVQSFDQQATIAASSFAQDLTKTGGDPIGAEGIYQTGVAYPSSGPTEGQAVLTGVLGDVGGIVKGAAGAAGSAIGGVASSALSGLVAPLVHGLLYLAFIAGGIVLVILGLQRLTGAKAPTAIPVPIPL